MISTNYSIWKVTRLLIISFLYVGLVKTNLDNWKNDCITITKLLLCFERCLEDKPGNN